MKAKLLLLPLTGILYTSLALAQPCTNATFFQLPHTTLPGETACVETNDQGKAYTAVEFILLNCGACREGVREIKQLLNDARFTNAVELKIVSIDRPRSADELREYLNITYGDDNRLAVKPRYAVDRELSPIFSIQFVPTFKVFNTSGVVVYEHVGTFSQDELAVMYRTLGL